MNAIEGLLILLALPLGLLLTGYWLAALLEDEGPLDRLAYAVAGGLVWLLAAVATVNFFRPISGGWAYGCLAPILLTVLLPRSRRSLANDLASLARGRPWPFVTAAAAFFVLLLWPMIVTPTTIFYDGTSNHDSFFWIAGAEHLKRHTYMATPAVSPLQPLSYSAQALIGWNPPWGRMGAEGLLALASGVVGASPLKLYLYATASLVFVWFALGYLLLRTFVTTTPARVTGIALLCLQPLFVFFYGNANLPNLLGTLAGTAAILATERALRAGLGDRAAFTAWAVLLALSLHGLFCSYPEMVPFVLMPCGLLWLRPWFTRGPRATWAAALTVLAVMLAGLALNPASTVRGVAGFMASFSSARADVNWANLFNPLDLSEYIPGLTSLSILGAKELEWWFGWPLSAVLVVVGTVALWRSRDRFGFAAGLSGGAALLIYTIVTQFAYGWQKTVQFSALFVCLLFPVAAIETLWRARDTTPRSRRWLPNVLIGSLLVFFAYTTVMNCRDIYKWSDRKVISADWFALRTLSREGLADKPVLVEAATFRMAFFHGMWAAYFLPESALYFGARGEENGGYLRAHIINEAVTPIPEPAAVLVGRKWADTFDANSPRLLSGLEYALVERSNRVFALRGVTPLNGPPDRTSGAFDLEIVPHRASVLVIELAPLAASGWPAAEWRVQRKAPDTTDFTTAITGASPWELRVPLVPGQRNAISIALAGHTTPDELSFVVRRWEVQNAP